MDEFRYERPDELLRRLKLGREETMQRLLTSLILGAPYPKWNTRSRPGAAGIVFLRSLFERCFGEPWPGDDLTFVDEYELRGRSDAEQGGAPDWAVLWNGRIWLIELKSERGSHRHDQIPGYFTLGRHHHPECQVDITYLTPTMQAPHTTSNEWERYAHLTWPEVVSLIRQAWPSPSDDGQAAVVAGVIHAIEHLATPPADWLRSVRGVTAAVTAESVEPTSPSAPVAADSGGAPPSDDGRTDDGRTDDGGTHDGSTDDVVERAVALACATADDGVQRALDVRFDSLDSLLEVRFRVRERIAAEPVDAVVRHVMPWVWREQSTGRPLTEAGRTTGYELRLSKYRSPQV